MKRTILLLSALFMLLFNASASANGVKVRNVWLDKATGDIHYDIKWDNSWSDDENHDAVWVFAKFRLDSGEWYHCTLNSAMSGSGSNTNIIMEFPTDSKGVFMYRDTALQPAVYSGQITTENAYIRWSYSADLFGGATMTNVREVKVFAIEMVYVTPGPYWLGDGNHTSESPNAFHIDDNSPALISNYTAQYVRVDSGAQFHDDYLFNKTLKISGTLGIDIEGDTYQTNANFPTGYQAFYCMKYEISQGEYAAFLNTLSRQQRANRYDPGNYGVNRYTIYLNNYESFEAERPDRACGFLNNADIMAYLHWSALRPMTELEFEKACRGPVFPMYNERAWGDSNYTQVTAISGPEDGTATVSGNCHVEPINYHDGDGGVGPLRCGIFAASGFGDRHSTGATYYGIMEMSGNLWEKAITVADSVGREFGGMHGDGNLDLQGNTTNATWPSPQSGEGFMERGGSYQDGLPSFREETVSARLSFFGGRRAQTGGRGVRTAP